MHGRARQRIFILTASIKKIRLDEGTPNLIIDRFFTATIVVGFIFVLQIFSSSVALASEARARLDSDW